MAPVAMVVDSEYDVERAGEFRNRLLNVASSSSVASLVDLGEASGEDAARSNSPRLSPVAAGGSVRAMNKGFPSRHCQARTGAVLLAAACAAMATATWLAVVAAGGGRSRSGVGAAAAQQEGGSSGFFTIGTTTLWHDRHNRCLSGGGLGMPVRMRSCNFTASEQLYTVDASLRRWGEDPDLCITASAPLSDRYPLASYPCSTANPEQQWAQREGLLVWLGVDGETVHCVADSAAEGEDEQAFAVPCSAAAK